MATRDWTIGKRMAWWAKFAVAMAAGIVSLASAAKILGVSVDLQTKTEARAQHEEMRQELKSEQLLTSSRIEAKVDRINDRLDTMLFTLVPQKRQREKE